MKLHKILVFCFVMSLYSCQKNSKDTVQKNSVQKKNPDSVENIIPKPKYDLKTVVITEENVVDFLTWYGEQNPENRVKIECSFGVIEVELYEQTPLHRANFIYLVKKNYFNTTYFHRVVKNFIVQGGNSDETITQKERKNIGKYFIPAEFVKSYKHKYGALASARTWENNPEKLSNPFEFYFVQNKNGAHHLDGEHTVFGKIISGFDVLDEIASQKTDEGEYPLLNIKIKVTLSE